MESKIELQSGKADRKRAGKFTGKVLTAKQKEQVRQMIHVPMELKYWLLTSIGASCAQAGAIDPLTEVPQGDGDSTRDGDSLKGSVLEFNLEVRQTLASTQANMVRVIVFQWNQTTAPTTGNVIESGLTSTANCPLGVKDFDTRQNSKFLIDELICLPEQYTAVSSSSFIKRFKIPLSNRIQFDAGAVTGINKLYVFYASDTTTNVPKLSYVSRFLYYDA